MKKRQNSYKFPLIPARISEIPGNSRREFWVPRFPGIPERKFPVALTLTDEPDYPFWRIYENNSLNLKKQTIKNQMVNNSHHFCCVTVIHIINRDPPRMYDYDSLRQVNYVPQIPVAVESIATVLRISRNMPRCCGRSLIQDVIANCYMAVAWGPRPRH